jgi:hypothetical protein
MRRRLAFLWLPLVLGLALLLPASTAAATYGKIVLVNSYCSGTNTVNATFKVVKYSGFYATKLTITAKAQRYYSGGWHTVYTIGTSKKSVYTSGKATLKRYAWYRPGRTGRFRILAVGKIWNGARLLAKGKQASYSCR